MQTSIDIDEGLLRSAMEFTGLKTEKEVLEEGLRVLTKQRREAQREALEILRTLGPWEGDLDDMRRDKPRRPIE